MVSWLEDLATQQLKQQSLLRLAPGEGVWRETMIAAKGGRSAGGKASGGATAELDPDAPTRGVTTLSQGDQKSEERIASHLWQLVRAGELPLAYIELGAQVVICYMYLFQPSCYGGKLHSG